MSDQAPVNIVPGQQLTDEQKKQLAEENRIATENAHKLAEQAKMQQDNRPVDVVVGESIKEKFKSIFPNNQQNNNEPQQ